MNIHRHYAHPRIARRRAITYLRDYQHVIYDRDGTITTFLDGGQWGPQRTGKDYYRLHLHLCHWNYFGDINYYAIMQNTSPFKEYCDDYYIYDNYG